MDDTQTRCASTASTVCLSPAGEFVGFKHYPNAF